MGSIVSLLWSSIVRLQRPVILLEGLGPMHHTEAENAEQIPGMLLEYFQDVHLDQSKDVSGLLPINFQSNSLLLRSNNLRNYSPHLQNLYYAFVER